MMTLDMLLCVAGELQFPEEPFTRHQGHTGDHRERWAHPAGAAEQGKQTVIANRHWKDDWNVEKNVVLHNIEYVTK